MAPVALCIHSSLWGDQDGEEFEKNHYEKRPPVTQGKYHHNIPRHKNNDTGIK